MYGVIKLREWICVALLSLFILMINVNPLVVNAAIYDISSSIEKTRVSKLTEDYQIKLSEHFIIKYTKEDEANISMIMEELEDSYKKLEPVFNSNSNEKIIIIVFNNTKDMNQTLNLSSSQKSMGLYYSGFISVLSPDVWIRATKEQKEKIYKTKGPVLHELVHYFVDKKSKNNYPEWFTEGVALYFEKELLGFEMKDAEDIKYSIDQLSKNFENLNQESAYRSSFDIISEYVKEHGETGLLEIIDKLGEGYSFEEFRNL